MSQRGESRDRCLTLTLDELLALRPTDDHSWRETFRYIEENHQGNSSEYWDRFLADIQQRGVLTPIVVSGGGSPQWTPSRMGSTQTWTRHYSSRRHGSSSPMVLEAGPARRRLAHMSWFV